MNTLYYENPYEKNFTAEIINVIEKENKYHIELDKTYFYPECEGQPSDTGFIESAPILYVYEELGKLYHVVEVKPLKIHRVKCTIAWDNRYDYMQQHLGQHIISATLLELLKANTVAVHLGKDNSYIDIDKLITREQMVEVEEMAMKVVSDNIKVEVLYPNKAELKKLPIKKSNWNSNEKIRLIGIKDIELSTCHAAHLNSTIEVQIIKLNKLSKHGNGSRIEFLCGKRAVSDYFFKHEAIEKMAKSLHCDAIYLFGKVASITDELNKAIAEKATLKGKVAEYEVQNLLNSCENIKDVWVLKEIYDNMDLKYAKLLASNLTCHPGVVVLFGIKYQDQAHLLFMCSKDLVNVNMNLLMKDTITLIDGNGGGSSFSAQGAGKSINNLSSSINYAYNKIKGAIMPSL